MAKKKGTPLAGIIATFICAGAVIGIFVLMLSLTGRFASVTASDACSVSDKESNASVESSISEAEKDELDSEITVNLTNASGQKLPAKIKQLIIDYTKKRYRSMSTLKTAELTEFFDTNDRYGRMYAAFNNGTLDYLNYVRMNRPADYRFKKANVDITVTQIETVDASYTIDFYINDAVDFNCSEKTSYSVFMETEAIVRKDADGQYKFTQMAEDTDVNLLLEEKVTEALGYDFSVWYLKDIELPDDFDSGSEIKKFVKEMKLSADEDLKSQAQLMSMYNSSPDKYATQKTAENKYNREKAVAYSYRYVGKDTVTRNDEYSDYSGYGGNCQNYCSQCILAGGIPMDIYGDQWKWFGDEVNGYEEEYGRSGSWAGTEYFYEYCGKNTGYGMVADTSMNMFAAEKGDIMQYVIDGWAHHSVVVTDVITDENGQVVDFLINSNTTDRTDFPLSAYGYTNIRLIHIVGNNN